MRVVTIVSAQDDGACIFWVAKFPVGTFAAHFANKSGGFKLRNQLSDFSRHILAKTASVDETLSSTCFRKLSNSIERILSIHQILFASRSVNRCNAGEWSF
jgi:hypothetical protein